MKPVEIVHHGHVKWSRGRALFLVSTDVQIMVTGSSISQPVNQPGITVISKDDRFVRAEHRIEITIRQTVRMLARRFECHQIPDLDHSNLQLREMLAKQV